MTDTTETTAKISETIPKDKKVEKIEKQEIHKARVEALAKTIEDPNIPEDKEDRQASILYLGLQESFKKAGEQPSDNLLGLDGSVGSYRSAFGAAKAMDDDPAEVVKAISALREFNQHVGLAEYKVDLGPDGEKLQGDEKRAAIKAKIREDVAKMPEKYAHREMLPIYEMIARKEELQEEVISLLPKVESVDKEGDGKDKKRKLYKDGINLVDLPSRTSVRFDAFEIQKVQSRIDYTTDWLVNVTGDKDLAEAVIKARREKTEEKSNFKPWNERTEEDKEAVVNQRHESLRNQIKEGLDQKALDTFDSIPEDKRKSLVADLVQSEVKAEKACNDVERSMVTADASQISDRLNQAKEARLDVKDNLAQIQIALAAQKAENSAQNLADVTGNFSKRKASFTDVIRFGVEAVKDKVGALVEPFKQQVIKAADQAKGYAEEESEKFAEEITKASEEIHSVVIKDSDLALQDIKRGVNNLREKMVSVKPNLERGRLGARSKFMRTVGNIARGADMALYQIAFEAKIAEHSLDSAIREGVPRVVEKVFGMKALEDEDRAKFERARDPELVKRKRERIQSLIKEKVNKKHEGSPGDEYFWGEAMKYVKENIETPEQPAPEPEIEQETEQNPEIPFSEPPKPDEQPDKNIPKPPDPEKSTEKNNTGLKEKLGPEGERKDNNPKPSELKTTLEIAQVEKATAKAKYEEARKDGKILSAYELYERNQAEIALKKATEKLERIQAELDALVNKSAKKQNNSST